MFKVPRYAFERTGIFATIFSLPAGEGKNIEGASDEHPFKLEGISKVDFEIFLRAVYPRLATLSQTPYLALTSSGLIH